MSDRKRPLVSVVMAVHNADLSEITASCESILKQTFQNFEFIIVDDINSNDVTRFLKKLENDNAKVKVIRNPQNCGLTLSLIKGISQANGVYIARQDADDISFHDRLEMQVERFDKDPSLALLGTGYISENQLLKTKKIENHGEDHFALIELLFSINPFCHSSVMFTKNHYLKVGGYDQKYRTSQDFDLWFRLAKVGRIGNLPTALVTRRLTDCSLSSSKRRAVEQINNGLRVRLRERELFQGSFFYPRILSSYARALLIIIIVVPFVSRIRALFFK